MAGMSTNLCYLGKPPNALHQSMKSPSLMAVSLSPKDRSVVSPVGALLKKYSSSSLQVMSLKNRSSAITHASVSSSSLTDHSTPIPIPIYVMVPLGTIAWNDEKNKSELMDKSTLKNQLFKLKENGVDGVMVDCWWGLVEIRVEEYHWEGYTQLFELVKTEGLKLQVVMSFHSCGGNVGDDVNITLPNWVLDDIGNDNPNIFFTDEQGRTNKECLSWGIDDKRVLHDRSAVDVYSDFMDSFRKEFSIMIFLAVSMLIRN